MVATTSHSMPSLVKLLRRDYPDLEFKASSHDAWNPAEATVLYQKGSSDSDQILHELGHAVLMHTSYRRDIELLGMERDAWAEAKKIAEHYGLTISPDAIESHMDTYRDWLHARSTCPKCEANGIQTDDNIYRCLACHAVWRVNDARTCGLRRYTLKQKQPLL